MSAAPAEARRRFGEAKEWLHAQAEELRAQAAKLTRDVFEGRQAAAKRRVAQKEADQLERRVSRLLRSATQIEAAAAREEARLRKIGKSKSPRDQADLVVAALDELPIDLAVDVLAEAGRRLRERKGSD